MSREEPAHFTAEYWEEHYRHHRGHRSLSPNPHLVDSAAGLPPASALDAGCGQGASAIWLASRGWRVTAVDIAANALARARPRAEAEGPELAARIDWVQGDLTRWSPAGEFDLVLSCYVHPAGSTAAYLARLAGLVAPGGMLLVVTHAPRDPASEVHGPESAILDPERWRVEESGLHTRESRGGHDAVRVQDSVLRARRLC